MIGRNKSWFLLFFCALFIVVSINMLFGFTHQYLIYPDSESYYEAAQNIYVYYRGHHDRPMVLAALHGIPFLFKASPVFIYTTYTYVFNFIFFIGFYIVLFQLFLDTISRKKALFLTLFSMTFITLFTSVFHMLSETVFMFFIVLGFYFLNLYFKEKKYGFAVVSVTIFILSMLVRPGMKYFAILLLLYFAKEIFKNKKQKISWLVYGSLFLVFVQAAGLKYQFGNFRISYIDTTTYYRYLGTKADFYKKGIYKFDVTHNSRATYFSNLSVPDRMEAAGKDFKNQLMSNPKNLLLAFFDDVVENATTGSTNIAEMINLDKSKSFEYWRTVFYKISVVQNIVFSILGYIIGFLTLYKNKLKNSYGFIAVFILYIFITSGVSFNEGDRFNVVTFPFVILLLSNYFLKAKPFFAPLQK